MRKFLMWVAVLFPLAAVAGCQEDLRGGAACPGLCPEQALDMRDVMLTPIVLDSTLVGYPPAGAEFLMLLAHRPDTVQTAVIVRFDEIPNEYPGPGDVGNLPVQSYDAVALRLVLDQAYELEAPLTVEVFNVDTLAPDLDFDAVREVFRANRLIHTVQFEAGDSLQSPLVLDLPAAQLSPVMTSTGRLRLGVRFQSGAPFQARVASVQSGSSPLLNVTPVLATGPQDNIVTPSNGTPLELGPRVPEMADYTLVLEGSPPVPTDRLVVGGLPGRRVYMRFDFPAGLVETTTVVRATLLLTQIANEHVGPTDTVVMQPRAVLANPNIEPGKAALLVAELGSLGLGPARSRPIDDGDIGFDIAQLVRQWRTMDTTLAQRAIVIHAGQEGLEPQEIHFHSMEAADPEVRPRLRLTYIPRSNFGLPQ